MDKGIGNYSLVTALALMLVLVLSVGTSAFANSGLAQAGKVPLAEHHKPGHDKGNGKGPFGDDPQERGNSKDKEKGNGRGVETSPMLQPVPNSLDNFELNATGMALAKRDGRDGPFTDAEVNLRASVLRHEGNHFRFLATGTVDLEGEGEFDVVDATGIIIFFKNPRGGNAVSGLMHIVGKNVVDEDGNELGKFRLRALVLGEPNDDTWRIIVFPAAKLGNHMLLVNMDGTIEGISGSPTSPGSADLHHFVVSPISSTVPAGSAINVTVTAHMSNGTLLTSYEDKAKITDSTGSVRPFITPRFQDGVFTGKLNITKATASDKVRFTDVNTNMTGESNTFAVLTGPLSRIELTPSAVDVGPGEKAQFSAKGTDKFGNEVSGLTFVWSLSSQDHGSISTAGNNANFTAASTVSSNVSLNLTASAGGMSDSSTISISPDALQLLDHFIVGNVSSPQTAGALFQVTVKAVNATGSAITDYTGPIHLSDSTGSLDVNVTSGFVNGTWTGSANITKADDEVKITAKDIESPSKTGSSNEFEIVAGALDHFELGAIANQTSGAQFNIVVRAQDKFDNLKTDYQGNVTLTTNNGASPAGNLTQFVPSSHNFTGIDGGEHSFAATMYNAKEEVTVTASGSGKSGTSNEFTVAHGAVAEIEVSPTSATVSPGATVTFTAEASDSFGNPVGGANFEWSLDSDVLGTLNETPSSAAEFTASASIPSTTSGTVTAEIGAVSGSASITVQV